MTRLALVLDLVVRRVGEQHGARNRERLDPRGDVDRIAGQPLGLDDDFADVDPDPHRNVQRREFALHRDRGLHRCQRAREHREAAVAEPLDDRSAGRGVLDGRARAT